MVNHTDSFHRYCYYSYHPRSHGTSSRGCPWCCSLRHSESLSLARRNLKKKPKHLHPIYFAFAFVILFMHLFIIGNAKYAYNYCLIYSDYLCYGLICKLLLLDTVYALVILE